MVHLMKFALRWLLTLVFVVVFGGFGLLVYHVHSFSKTSFYIDKAIIIDVQKGMSTAGIISQMLAHTDNGNSVIPGKTWEWNLLVRLKRVDKLIKAGEYELKGTFTPVELLEQMVRGDVRLLTVQIIEGLTFAQVRESLAKNPNIKHDSKTMSDTVLRENLKLTTINAEGMIFPDTYHVMSKTTDLEVLAMAASRLRDQLEKAWAQRDADLPLKTPYEALILASIVEKETGKHEDRPNIASVFINRLRIKMPLQSDPTVIYGMGKNFDGNIRRVDLERPTAYNTYVISALPPTPIATVGLASLKAVLNPPKTDYLYFVARGDGSSEFSSNLRDHNAAVDRFQRKRPSR